jgi:RP/EB family microtubule-associated protein
MIVSTAADSDAKIAEQTQKIAKLRLAVEGLEKERDFYFAKLREIEVMCQEEAALDAAALKEKILEILYKTDDEEFEAPQDGDHA